MKVIDIVMVVSSSGIENAFGWSEGGWYLCMG